MKDFEGKTVVVTGGSSGIGAATAKLLAERGAQLVLFARHAEDLERAQKETSGTTRCVAGDVRVARDVERLFDVVGREFGGADGLFVNAGVAEFVALPDADLDHYQRLMDSNVKGAFLTLKYALPVLRAGASVVFNTSVAADLGAPLCSVYSATKGAVAAFARSAATELLERSVRVNVVSPGPTATPIQGKSAVDEAAMARMAPYVMSRMRLGRLGQAAEVAEAAAFLLSSRSSFIVGQQLAVDGGMSGL